jgi:hypothetical protein
MVGREDWLAMRKSSNLTTTANEKMIGNLGKRKLESGATRENETKHGAAEVNLGPESNMIGLDAARQDDRWNGIMGTGMLGGTSNGAREVQSGTEDGVHPKRKEIQNWVAETEVTVDRTSMKAQRKPTNPKIQARSPMSTSPQKENPKSRTETKKEVRRKGTKEHTDSTTESELVDM